jgi:catechol 2,3-dioxygenase
MTDQIGPQTPCGVNHLVLNVRDIEASHRFWVGLLGFRQVGVSRRSAPGRPPMRFYSGERNGQLHHHDIALVEASFAGEAAASKPALNHVAIEYSTEEAWQEQIRYLLSCGVPLSDRIDRGVSKSIHLTDPNGYIVELVYELPRELWEGDIDAALNRGTRRPIVEEDGV